MEPTFSETHKQMHTDGSEICEICNIRFTPHNLQWHIKLKHLETIEIKDIKPERHRVLRSECHICRATFSTAWNLRMYLKMQQFVFDAKFSLSKISGKHLNVHDIGKLKCELCQIRFTPISLYNHEKKFHPDLPHTIFIRQPCPVCKTICGSKDALGRI